MNIRMGILRVITRFEEGDGNIDILIDREIKNSRIDHRDRRFLYEITYGMLRQQLYLDFIIDHFLKGDGSTIAPQLRRILRMGAYQILFLDKVPGYASVNEAVDEAKKNQETKYQSGLVNALLRNIIKNAAKLPRPTSTDIATRLSIEFSHPVWMIRRWLVSFGMSKTKKLLEFNNQKPDIFLRRRLRGISRQQFESAAHPLCDMPVGFQNLYYKLLQPVPVDELSLLSDGMCNIQSPSSGFVVAMLDIKTNDRILDMCSAPGGKSVLAAELAGDTGRVVAADLKSGRLKSVRENYEMLAIRNILLVAADGAHGCYRGLFDKVLCDAPCSGSGVLHRHPDGRWHKSESDLVSLVKTQKAILNEAGKLVVSKGILIYSTCSLEKEENEEVVYSFIENNPDFVLEPAPDAIPLKYTDSRGFLRITPHDHSWDGIFAARLRKK